MTVSDVTEGDGRPEGLAEGGRGLWAALVDRDPDLADPLNPTRVVAIQACRAKDRCDRAEDEVRLEPATVDNGKGQPVANPSWVEARQQENSLKQLVAALRLPDEATGKRPQRHMGGVSGRPPKSGTARVSSLERARAAKSAG